jgi:hypothetical protein
MKKNGGILCDRPKPTAGCSANGRRKKKKVLYGKYTDISLIYHSGVVPFKMSR